MTKMKNWWHNLKPMTRKLIIVGVVVMMIVSYLSPPEEPVAKHKPAGPHVVDVRGLTLPTARKQLKAHGNYTADAKAKGAIFGVLVEENFTVCEQGKPKGHLVPLKVSKRDC